MKSRLSLGQQGDNLAMGAPIRRQAELGPARRGGLAEASKRGPSFG